MPGRASLVLLLSLAPALWGCSRGAGLFSEANARAHVEMLAGTIGSRPVGTAANARARAYIVDQLKLFGFDVRVQETEARRPALGRTARVSNIIAIRQGTRPEAIGLVSHYDSSPYAPGAADDAFGVAVSLEAARVLAARAGRTWTLMVLVTDGEESGLMGAAGLMTDREVADRLKTYVNLEAIGSSGVALLFETGPANGWLVGPWARRAPHPRGGSYSLEIYRRLPNDTDFSILRQHDVPGLNFATVGDSYAYHTARDTADRLSGASLRQTGENVVAIVEGLDPLDITRRDPAPATYFDIGGTVALGYGPARSWLAVAAALLLGVIAWVKVTTAAVRIGGPGLWLLTAAWTAIGAVAVIASMIATTAALRAASAVYHPWYARPDRLIVALLVVGTTVGWGVSRAGAWLPARAHGLRHPAVTWSLALPAWLATTVAMLQLAPAAAYLWTLPLLAAGLLLVVTRSTSRLGLRAASLVVLGVSATLWLRETLELARFVVAVFGRLPIVTPAYAYAALLTVAGLMIAPPLIGAVTTDEPLRRPKLVTSLCLLAIAIATGAAYAAPAYTFQEPLRRTVRALQEPGSATATWEVGSVEPGLDLAPGAPSGWSPQTDAAPASVPWGRLPYPFVFRAAGPALGQPPLAVSGFAIDRVASGVELTLTVVPEREGLTITFVLPAGATPARSSLPGVPRLGRWTATYIAPPADGLVWNASFAGVDEAQLRDTKIAVIDTGFPGGAGWQRLPAWLPQEHAVWSATAAWVVPANALPRVAPLR